MDIPPIAVTLGEPAGVGPEVCLKAWHHCRFSAQPFFAIGPIQHYLWLVERLKIPTPIQKISSPNEAASVFSERLPILDFGPNIEVNLGNIKKQNTKIVLGIIEKAVSLIKTGQVSGIVTSPIHKDALYDVGFKFPGHTEFLSKLDNQNTPVMMLTSPGLRVVPITVHVALADVSHQLRTETIIEKVKIVDKQFFPLFNIEKPRLSVAGLNPHAGEGGHLGKEETLIINPAIKKLQELGYNVFGPISPDALFLPEMRQTYDVAICMYHDQALIPIKALDPKNTVNVTLGLSFVRTSPDHGTALNIANKGVAHSESMVAAINLASQMVLNGRATIHE